MNQTPPPRHPLLERQPDPRRLIGGAVSLLFHAALLVLVVRGAVDKFIQTPAAGNPLLAPGGGGGGGGGGGERVRYITLPPLQQAAAPAQVEQPAVPPPEVVPPAVVAPTPVPADTQPTPTVVVSSADSVQVAGSGGPGSGPGSGGGSGGGTGGGVGTGTGAGSGPGSGGGGGGGTGSDPQWTYGNLFFEKPPKELRGQTLRVTFYVRADGRVARIETDPKIENGEFARQFTERAEAFRFKPARNADGVAVPGVTTMYFSLKSN